MITLLNGRRAAGLLRVKMQSSQPWSRLWESLHSSTSWPYPSSFALTRYCQHVILFEPMSWTLSWIHLVWELDKCTTNRILIAQAFLCGKQRESKLWSDQKQASSPVQGCTREMKLWIVIECYRSMPNWNGSRRSEGSIEQVMHMVCSWCVNVSSLTAFAFKEEIHGCFHTVIRPCEQVLHYHLIRIFVLSSKSLVVVAWSSLTPSAH